MTAEAIKKFRALTAWSFSRYKNYRGCPRQFFLGYLKKLPQVEGPALKRGQRIHTEAEHYVDGTSDEMPECHENFRPWFDGLRDADDVRVEEEWAFTKDWKKTEWKNWAECWLRVKVDVAVPRLEDDRLLVIDHKTGRERPYQDQLELYAVSGFYRYPTVKTIRTEIWFLDKGTHTQATYTRSAQGGLRDKWERRVVPMFRDKRFAPTPGPSCGWCSFSAKKGGPCEFGA